jgi:hypothetical protein
MACGTAVGSRPATPKGGAYEPERVCRILGSSGGPKWRLPGSGGRHIGKTGLNETGLPERTK